MNFMHLICAVLCSLLLIALVYLIVLLCKIKKLKRESEADKQALIFVIGNHNKILSKELENVDYLLTEISTQDAEISTDVRVVARARKLLIEAIKKKETIP